MNMQTEVKAGKNVIAGFLIPRSLHLRLKHAAIDRSESMSKIVIEALDAFLTKEVRRAD